MQVARGETSEQRPLLETAKLCATAARLSRALTYLGYPKLNDH